MKNAIRTVTWRFEEATELVSEFADITSVTVKSAEDVFKHYRCLFKDRVRERFVVFWLDSANNILGFEVVTEGLLNSSIAHPREVFRGAIVVTASAIVIAHNHPSGGSEPSSEDVAMTNQLVESGKIIGIPVIDHIIFAGSGYTSMTERGLI